MARIISELRNRFLSENMVGKFIYVNVGVYVLFAFIDVVATLFNIKSPAIYLKLWLELPSSLPQFILQPWSILTYMFLHGGLMHLLWNMIALYWFGKIFLSFFSTRHFVGVYLLGGIVGGLFFMLAYNIFPFFSSSVAYAGLVGASAAVLAVVTAAAYRVPDYRINLLFIGEITLKTFAIATIVISILLTTSDNAGGSFAHLGGAFSGYLFAYYLNKGRDLTFYINKAVDAIAGLCNRLFNKAKTPKMKIFKGKHADDYEYNSREKKRSENIDTILEKVKKYGYSSLTEDEKKQLFDASNRGGA